MVGALIRHEESAPDGIPGEIGWLGDVDPAVLDRPRRPAEKDSARHERHWAMRLETAEGEVRAHHPQAPDRNFRIEREPLLRPVVGAIGIACGIGPWAVAAEGARLHAHLAEAVFAADVSLQPEPSDACGAAEVEADESRLPVGWNESDAPSGDGHRDAVLRIERPEWGFSRWKSPLSDEQSSVVVETQPAGPRQQHVKGGDGATRLEAHRMHAVVVGKIDAIVDFVDREPGDRVGPALQFGGHAAAGLDAAV